MDTEKDIDVTIMGHKFRVNCQNEEYESLLLAVSYLNNKIKQIKDEGKVVGSERIAVIAALGMTHELLILQNDRGFDISEFKRRMGPMQEKQDEVLVQDEVPIEPDDKLQ